VVDEAERRRFERLVLPHLDAAYNLARWLARNDEDARDIVQEAVMRALRYFAGFRGENARPWLLQIVRHASFAWLQENRTGERDSMADADAEPHAPPRDEPLPAMLDRDERRRVNTALAALPVHYKEVLVLRELEDLSYRDISLVVDVPLGTVMSRLARARQLMRDALSSVQDGPGERPESSRRGSDCVE
jgi:RNA polymerase sigma-70 factor, ECF subfamily